MGYIRVLFKKNYPFLIPERKKIIQILILKARKINSYLLSSALFADVIRYNKICVIFQRMFIFAQKNCKCLHFFISKRERVEPCL